MEVFGECDTRGGKFMMEVRRSSVCHNDSDDNEEGPAVPTESLLGKGITGRLLLIDTDGGSTETGDEGDGGA